MSEIIDAHGGVVRVSDYRAKKSSWCRLLEEGVIVRALPSVAIAAGLVENPKAWIRAVSLWNPNAVIAGRAAAALTFQTDIEVKVIPVYARGRLQDRGPIRFRRDTIDDGFLTWAGDIRVTGPSATAVTAGLEGDFEPGSTALRLGAVSPEVIAEHAAGWSLRSRARARAVAHALSGNPWSVAEVAAHQLFRDAGILGWRGNAPVWLNGRRLVPDISLPEAKIGFEINSFEFHSSRDAMERDSGRSNLFLAAGWRLYALTPRQILRQREETIEFIRSVVWQRHRGNQAFASA